MESDEDYCQGGGVGVMVTSKRRGGEEEKNKDKKEIRERKTQDYDTIPEEQKHVFVKHICHF